MNKPKYPSPYDMSDITYINTEPKIEFVKTKSIENAIEEINRKLDLIIEALRKSNETT